jgi:integrase
MSTNEIQERTWRETWQRAFDRLPQDEPISESLILAVIFQTEPNSNIRRRLVQQLQRLCDFAGLQLDLSRHKGNYSAKSVEPRDIPTDVQIAQWRDLMKSEPWRWCYGMLASFGLRPHELFFCSFQDAHTAKVSDGKTGDRIVRAVPPTWVQDWRLRELEGDRPLVKGRTLRDYGQRVSRQFNRCGIPIDPYDLRHSYAIRGSVTLGLPLSTMAAMMGHSVQIHTQTYHRWLSDATNEAVYRRMVLGDNQG